MRTGPIDEPLDIDLSFVHMIESISLAIVSRAFEVAARYCAAAGREVPTETDCVYGLRFEVRRFSTDDSIEEKVKEIQSIIEHEREQAEEEENDSGSVDFESGSSDDSEEDLGLVPDSEIAPFCRADETCIPDEDADFVRAVHEAVDTWDEWSPSDPVERYLKATVEKNPVKIQRHFV